jgi:hypothetical protein
VRYGILHNNRVEGISPGAYFDIDEMESDFFYNGKTSYATAERQRSVSGNSFVALKKDHRINHAMTEGNDNAVQFQFGYMSNGMLPFPFQSTNLINISGRVSHPAFGSGFNYWQLSFYGNLRFRSFYSTMFIAPYFFFAAEGGIVSGKFSIQHLFAPSPAFFYSPAGMLKGTQPYDLLGQKYFAVQGEHNWQWLPLTFLGKKWSEGSGMQIITGGCIANVWNNSSYFLAQQKWNPYWEAYVGIANILNFFRMNAVHTSKNTDALRLSLSSAAIN